MKKSAWYFLTDLQHFNALRNSEARILFRPGKNRDGFFSHEDIVRQVEHAIDIFNTKAQGRAQGLFLFDNAPSHVKRAPDALSARKMPKGALKLLFCILIFNFIAGPKAGWTHEPNGPRMRPGRLSDGSIQELYYPENHPVMPGWFKGMEQLIRERGLWPADGRSLSAQCTGFKCEPGRTDCCCRRILFNESDFAAQKSHLHEIIESRGHLCDFYPKYHCELNFIEQYWGAAKLHYRNGARPATMDEMQAKVLKALDSVDLLTIRR
jgi:hypothetical protein